MTKTDWFWKHFLFTFIGTYWKRLTFFPFKISCDCFSLNLMPFGFLSSCMNILCQTFQINEYKIEYWGQINCLHWQLQFWFKSVVHSRRYGFCYGLYIEREVLCLLVHCLCHCIGFTQHTPIYFLSFSSTLFGCMQLSRNGFSRRQNNQERLFSAVSYLFLFLLHIFAI